MDMLMAHSQRLSIIRVQAEQGSQVASRIDRTAYETKALLHTQQDLLHDIQNQVALYEFRGSNAATYRILMLFRSAGQMQGQVLSTEGLLVQSLGVTGQRIEGLRQENRVLATEHTREIQKLVSIFQSEYLKSRAKQDSNMHL